MMDIFILQKLLKVVFLSATMSDPGSLRVGVIEQLPGCAKPKKESLNKLNETRVLLEGLGHACENRETRL